MSETLLIVKVGGLRHFARQPTTTTLCDLEVWGRRGTLRGDADCPKCMVAAERRWTVNCTSCGWTGFRLAPSAARAQEKPCPHCGEPVKAVDRG